MSERLTEYAKLVSMALIAVMTAGCLVSADDRGEHRPVFTPDGEHIVFMSNIHGGDWELFRAKADGSGVERLTENKGWDGYADVSPDGKQLVFDRGSDDYSGPFLLNLESGEVQQLGNFKNKAGGARFSPDGRRVVIFEEVDEKRDLWLIHPQDGWKMMELTHTPEMNEHDAAFSPNGEYIAFAVALEKGSALDIMNMRSRERRRLLQMDGYLYGVNWSPDGEQIVFNASDGNDQELFLVDTDGANQTQLTDNEFSDHLPSWDPSGERLIFTSERTGREEIHVFDLTTRQAARVELSFAD